MGASFLVDLVHRSPRGGALNRPDNSHPLALSILDKNISAHLPS